MYHMVDLHVHCTDILNRKFVYRLKKFLINFDNGLIYVNIFSRMFPL